MYVCLSAPLSISSLHLCPQQLLVLLLLVVDLLFIFTVHVDPVLMLVLYTVALVVVQCSDVVSGVLLVLIVLLDYCTIGAYVQQCYSLYTSSYSSSLYNISSLLLVATVNSQCYCQCWSYSQWLLLVVLYAYAGQRIEGHVVYCTRLCMLCYTMLYYVKLCSILSTLHAVYLSYYLISSLHLSDGLCILLLLLLVVLA